MIAWEIAPEGTTHFFTRHGGQWWIKRVGDVYHWWSVGRSTDWLGRGHVGGGGNFNLLDPNNLYAFGEQEPIGVMEFVGANPFDVAPEQPKPKRKVGWW